MKFNGKLRIKLTEDYFYDKKKREELHDNGEWCGEEKCQECCGHEYDPNEGMMCINCDKEYDY